jgi:hypothetical protein
MIEVLARNVVFEKFSSWHWRSCFFFFSKVIGSSGGVGERDRDVFFKCDAHREAGVVLS